MFSRKTIRIQMRLLVIASSLFFSLSSAQARSTPALGGTPWNPADADCLEAVHGSITNNCPGAVSVNFALPTDTSNDKVVRVAAYIPNGSMLECQALGTDWQFGTFFYNGFVRSTVVDTPIELVTRPAFVPPRGSLIVQCSLGANVRIVSFDWNQ